MLIDYQQMRASNQEIISYFQDEQVVADLLEQFNQVVDDDSDDSDDSDYKQESDYTDSEYEDGEISDSDTESEDEKENTNPVSQPVTPTIQISLPNNPPQLTRQRNMINIYPITETQSLSDADVDIRPRELLGNLSNITIRRRLHFN